MKIKFTEVPIGGCFHDKKGRVVKRISEERCATMKGAKVSKGKCPKKASVETATCPLGLLGAALPNRPKAIVEIGSPFLWEMRGRT